VLVIADTNHPGWRAKIDGRSAEVIWADGMVKALLVEPGSQRVKLSFMPRTLILGAALSGLSLVILLTLACYSRLWSKHGLPFVMQSKSS